MTVCSAALTHSQAHVACSLAMGGWAQEATGRAVVVHEAPRSFGPGAEIVSRLMEKAFYHLEAPIERVAGFDVVIPLFSREKAYLPSTQRIIRASRKVLAAQ